MSLATRLERAIRERDEAESMKFDVPYWFTTSKVINARNAVRDAMEANESAILAALKFQEAVERHGMTVCKSIDDVHWEAGVPGIEVLEDTPAAAVEKLVAALEKK